MWNNSRGSSWFAAANRYIEKFHSLPARSEEKPGSQASHDRDWCGECNFLRLRRARLSSPMHLFPYVPISPAPTRAFVLIRSEGGEGEGWIQGEILRGRRMLSSPKVCRQSYYLRPSKLRAASGIAQLESSILIRANWKTFERKHSWGRGRNKQTSDRNGERSLDVTIVRWSTKKCSRRDVRVQECDRYSRKRVSVMEWRNYDWRGAGGGEIYRAINFNFADRFTEPGAPITNGSFAWFYHAYNMSASPC